MKNLDYTGLDAAKVAPVVEALQQLLADFQIYYTNLRAFHWHIKGSNFFSLHESFEKIYDEVNEKVDEIAERILQLDGTPLHNYSDYLKIAKVQEVGIVACGRDAINNILDTLRLLIAQERLTLELAGEAQDEVTAALLGDCLAEQEKLIWMLTSYQTKLNCC